jgi:hypothetical protein
LNGFESRDDMRTFLASRLNQTADNVNGMLGRIGNLMNTAGSLFDRAPIDPAAYLLARGLSTNDIARLGQTSAASEAVSFFAPILGPVMQGMALDNDQRVANSLHDIGFIDKDTYGLVSTGIQSAQDRAALALAIGAGLGVAGGVVGAGFKLYERLALGEARIARELNGAADRAVQQLAADRAAGVTFKSAGAEGTRAHQYFRDDVIALNQRLEARGSSYRVADEEFRFAVAPGQPRGGLAPYERAPGSRGVDAVLYRNHVPIRGFDLKTGGGWSPTELQALQQRFGIPIQQIFRSR